MAPYGYGPKNRRRGGAAPPSMGDTNYYPPGTGGPMVGGGNPGPAHPHRRARIQRQNKIALANSMGMNTPGFWQGGPNHAYKGGNPYGGWGMRPTTNPNGLVRNIDALRDALAQMHGRNVRGGQEGQRGRQMRAGPAGPMVGGRGGMRRGQFAGPVVGGRGLGKSRRAKMARMLKG